MAPTPTPDTPDLTPVLSLSPDLVSGLIRPTPVDITLGANTKIVNADNVGFQSTLPITTSNLTFSKGHRILAGSTYKYFSADNFEIDHYGTITSKSTGTNTLAGGLTTAGLLTASGGVSTTNLTATTGDIVASVGGFTAKTGFTAQTGDFNATTGKFIGKGLQITSTDFNIDSVAKSISLTGSLDMKNSAATFALNSASGAITTFGNISTSGSGTITSAGSVSGASLNVGYYAGGKKALTIDGNGAITGKDVSDATIYSVGSDGSAFFKGTLQANGDVKFGATQQVTIAAATGNLVTPGSISSANITSSGNATISGNVSIGGTAGSPSILLSNSSTSTFANSVSVGGKNTLGSDGSASLAAGNFAVAATGDLVSKGTASFGNNAVTLGTASLTNAKVSVDSAGNVAAAGTLSVANDFKVATDKFVVTAASGNVAAAGTLSAAGDLKVATNKFVVTAASGNVAATGDLAINTNKFNVSAASGNVTAAGTLSAAGDLAINTNKFNVTAASGNVAAAGTMSVASDLKVATDKFVVTAASGNVAAKGTGSFVGDLKVLNADGTTNFEINSSDATAHASFANGNVKITSAGAVVDSIAYSEYVPSASVTNTTTTTFPTLGSAEDTALFGSATKNWLTTQEYVDRSIFHTTKRLNYLVGSDVSPIINKLDNYIKVLAEIDGSSSAAIIAGLQGDYSMLNVTVDSIIGSSYNSILINCVPSVWGDECPPLPIPDPVTQFYQGDGWYFSNIGDTNKINWYFPVSSNMKVNDIQNLFINLFAVSSKEMPSIVVYTKPKNNASDLFTGFANARIVYAVGVPTASKSLSALKQYVMYTNSSPSNIYIDSASELQSLGSVTTNGVKSTAIDFSTTHPTSFSATYDPTIVTPTDDIAFFGLLTTGLENIKDIMFVLQSFNVSLKTGTTQMLFKNTDVVNNYIMNTLFKKNSDFSNYLDNPEGYLDNFIAQAYAKSLVTLQDAAKKPDILESKLSLFRVNNSELTSFPGSITLPSTTTSSTQIPVKIVAANSPDKIQVFLNNVKVGNDVLGVFDRNITGLLVGNNELRVSVVTTGNNVTTTRLVNLIVPSSDATLKTILVNAISKDVANQSIQNNSVVNLPAGTANATIYVTTNASLVNSCKVMGGTTPSTELVANGVVSPNGILINGLVTGDNTITITTKSDDLSSTTTTTFKLRVLSGDTSLAVFTIEGENALIATTINLGSTFAGKTIGQLNIVRNTTASTSTLDSVVLRTPTLQLGSNTMDFAVTAENGTNLTYSRTLYVKSSEAGLASVTINDVAKQVNGNADFILSSNTTSLNVVATPIANGKASVTISGQVTGLTPGMTTTITLSVQPEDTSIAPTNYSYSVHVQSNDADVDEVYINDNLITIANGAASVIVKDLVPPSSFSLKANESTASSTLAYKMETDGISVPMLSGTKYQGIGISPGNVNTLIINNTAEDGTTKDTTITISSLSTDISLSAFTATYGGSTNNVTSGQTISLASGVNDVVVAATSTYAGAEVTLDGVIGTGYSNKTISVPAGTTKEVVVNVKATDGTTTSNPYKVTFVAPQTYAQLLAQASTLQAEAIAAQATLTSAQTAATAAATALNTANDNFLSASNMVSIREVDLTAAIAEESAANGDPNADMFTAITNAIRSQLATAQAELAAAIAARDAAQATNDAAQATLTAAQTALTAAQAAATAAQAAATAAAPLSPDTSLSTFSVNGISVVYGSSVNLAAGTTSVNVVATPTSANAVVNVMGKTGLQEGSNTLSVEVTAENGATATYDVTLMVAAPAPQYPAITSFTINNVEVNSVNGVDYYYNNISDASDLIAVIGKSNTTSVSLTHPYFPIMLESTNGLYTTYRLFAPRDMDRAKFTITLSNNGVNKIYYLYVKGPNSAGYTL